MGSHQTAKVARNHSQLVVLEKIFAFISLLLWRLCMGIAKLGFNHRLNHRFIIHQRCLLLSNVPSVYHSVCCVLSRKRINNKVNKSRSCPIPFSRVKLDAIVMIARNVIPMVGHHPGAGRPPRNPIAKDCPTFIFCVEIIRKVTTVKFKIF